MEAARSVGHRAKAADQTTNEDNGKDETSSQVANTAIGDNTHAGDCDDRLPTQLDEVLRQAQPNF